MRALPRGRRGKLRLHARRRDGLRGVPARLRRDGRIQPLPLPLSVSDDEALFIGIVSLCEAVIDRLRVGKGDHIAVFGGREMGNILCQLLIYHQAVPIFVDPDDGALALAAQCGIYYTVRADQAMEENICRITGGRLAKDSVYFSGSDLSPSLPFAYTAADGTVIYTGFDFPDVTVAVRQALEKRLTVTAVTNDYSNNSTAINLIVNKAINLAPSAKTYGRSRTSPSCLKKPPPAGKRATASPIPSST